MDEVDRIIIQSLLGIGVAIDGDEVTSLQHFDADLIVMCVVSCLNAINPEIQGKYALRLPPSLSHRFRICSEIVQSIKDIGYKADFGYQTMLYPNDAEIRRLFMFLVERLPREVTETTQSETVSAMRLLQTRLAGDLRKRLAHPWQPHFFRRDLLASRDGHYFREGNKKCHAFTTSDLAELDKCDNTLVPTLMNHHSRLMCKEARSTTVKATPEEIKLKIEVERKKKHFSLVERIAHVSITEKVEPVASIGDIADNDKHEERKAELHQLQTTLNELVNQLNEGASKIKSVINKTETVLLRLGEVQSEAVAREGMLKSLRKIADLLPNAEENIAQIEAFLASAEERMRRLEGTFEEHYRPKVRERDELLVQAQQVASPKQVAEKAIEELEGRLQAMSNEKNDNKGTINLLTTKLAEMEANGKMQKRDVITNKITGMIGQISKQKTAIDKIKGENKDLQKDVNSLSGKLDRAFTVTDELIFKDATKDDGARKSYKLLASLHENCQNLLRGIEETGQIVRDIRELEDQIDLESKKKTVCNLENIVRDLQQVREENEKLGAESKEKDPHPLVAS